MVNLLLARRVAENCSILFCDARDDADMTAVLRGTHVYGDFLARLQDGAIPSGAAKNSRSAAFDGPFDLAAFAVIDGHIEPGMRICPFPFLDDTHQCDDLL